MQAGAPTPPAATPWHNSGKQRHMGQLCLATAMMVAVLALLCPWKGLVAPHFSNSIYQGFLKLGQGLSTASQKVEKMGVYLLSCSDWGRGGNKNSNSNFTYFAWTLTTGTELSDRKTQEKDISVCSGLFFTKLLLCLSGTRTTKLLDDSGFPGKKSTRRNPLVVSKKWGVVYECWPVTVS